MDVTLKTPLNNDDGVLAAPLAVSDTVQFN